MAASISYVVQTGKSYPKPMPKIYRLVQDEGVEIARYEINDFAEVIAISPEIFSNFISEYKEFLTRFVEAIEQENGISTFNYYAFCELESSAVYITSNIPMADRESAVDASELDDSLEGQSV
jgi:hypothetical protein